MSKKKLFLVGVGHGNPEDDKLVEVLVKKASRGGIVVGLESLVRDHEKETEYVRACGLNKGGIYGIEDDFALSLCLTAVSYFRLVRGRFDIGGMAEISAALRLQQLMNSSSFNIAWISLQGEKISKPAMELRQEINVWKLKYGNEEFQKASSHSYEAWLELKKLLSLQMLNQASNLNGSRKLDNERIRKFLEYPTQSEYKNFFTPEILVKWRNKFISPNVQQIADTAIQNGLSVYFPIGRRHIDDLSIVFGGEYKGMEVKKYKGLYGVFYEPINIISKRLMLRAVIS